MKVFKIAMGAAVAAMFLTTGQGMAKELPKDANTTCPVMMKEKSDPELYVEHEGQTIYVCCTKCKRKFKEDPEKYIQRVNEHKAALKKNQKASAAAGQ